MENNFNNIDLDIENYLREQEEKREIKKSANLVGGAYILLMLLPFFLTTMLTEFLKALGLPSNQITLLYGDPMFLTTIQIFLSIAMFVLPLGIILYGGHVKLNDIISFKKPKKDIFWPIILVCIGVSAFANIVTNIITSLLNGIGIPVTAPDFEMPQGPLGFIIYFLAIAVTPALVEELAFRGVYMGALKKYGKAFAVGVSAILFGMMHGNFAQMPFAFILGVAIGVAVLKTDSIWTGVIIHFINNGISVLLDLILSKNESAMMESFVVSLYFALCILAFFIGIYLFKGKAKDLVTLEDTPQSISLSTKFKWFFSSPTVIIAIVITGIECLAAPFTV